MSEFGGSPEFGPQIEQISSIEKAEIAGEKSAVHPEVARILQKIDQDLKKYETEQGLRNEIGQIESFANKPQELDPVLEIREVDRLPHEFSQTARELLTLAEIPVKDTEGSEDEVLPEPTADEMTEIYDSISQRLKEEPEAATLDSLLNILDSEIALTLDNSGLDEKVETTPQNYKDKHISKLNKLKIAKETLENMMKGKRVSSTSERGQAIYLFIENTKNKYDADKYTDLDPEIKALVGAAYAFFDSLYDQLPEDAYDEEDEDEGED